MYYAFLSNILSKRGLQPAISHLRVVSVSRYHHLIAFLMSVSRHGPSVGISLSTAADLSILLTPSLLGPDSARLGSASLTAAGQSGLCAGLRPGAPARPVEASTGR